MILKTRTRQLDRTKSINSGLIAYIDAETYISNADAVRVEGNPYNTFRRGKVAWRSNGDDYVYLLRNYPEITNLNFAVRLRFELSTIPSNTCSLFTCGDELRFSINSSGNTGTILVGDTSSTPSITLGLTTGKYYDLILMRVGSTCKIYLNGVLKGSFTNAGTTEYNEPIYIGFSPDTNYSSLDGYVYGFEAWNRELNIGEILRLYFDKFNRYHHIYHNPLDRLADIVVISEILTRTVVYNVSVSDGLVLDDYETIGGDKSVGIIETIYIDEEAEVAVNRIVSVSDMIAISDSGGKYHSQSVNDTVTIDDESVNSKSLVDSLTVGELVTAFACKATSDDLVVGESVTVTIVSNQNISDMIDVSDAGVGYFDTDAEQNFGTIFGGVTS